LSGLTISADLSPENSIKAQLPPWSQIESAYIAGIVDGEGCIGIYLKKNRGYLIQLTIVNTHKELLVWLGKMFHANACKSLPDKRPRNKQSFAITVDRMRAFKVLQRIQPYLIVKRKQADLAIQKETCKYFVQESRLLNQKGVTH
jgi:hypothetical protein